MDTSLFPGDGKILARTAKGDNIDRLNLGPVDFAHVAKMLHVRESVCRNADREIFNFRGPHRLNAVQRASQFKPTRTAEE